MCWMGRATSRSTSSRTTSWSCRSGSRCSEHGGPEHFQKDCSRAAGGEVRAVFLVFGFVLAQLQGSFGPAPSPKPRQNPRILAPNSCSISSNALFAADAEFFHQLVKGRAAHTQFNGGRSNLAAVFF